MDMAQVRAAADERAKVYGLRVRCPRCGAGVNKFCLRDGVMAYNGPADRVVHAERVALASR